MMTIKKEEKKEVGNLFDFFPSFQMINLFHHPFHLITTRLVVGVRDLRNKLQALELAQATVPTDSLPGSRLTSVSANFAQLVREKNLKPRSAEFITAAADFFASAAHAAVGGSSLNSDILYELCRDLRIDPIPSSNTQCKKVRPMHSRSHCPHFDRASTAHLRWQAIDRVHVNILDYLDYRRSAGASPLPVFTSFRQFSEYTVSHGKIFPKIYAKKSPVLKKLLKQIFCIHIVQMAASDANARCLVSFAVGMRARSA